MEKYREPLRLAWSIGGFLRASQIPLKKVQSTHSVNEAIPETSFVLCFSEVETVLTALFEK